MSILLNEKYLYDYRGGIRMITKNLEDAKLNRSIPEQLELPFNKSSEVVLDDHTGEVLDILDLNGYNDRVGEDVFDWTKVFGSGDIPIDNCAYMAIPIESMDKLETDLGLLKELVRVGQTDKAYRFIEILEEELFDKNGKEMYIDVRREV